jgi:AAA domain (dynein-related subfamily)/EVE domain
MAETLSAAVRPLAGRSAFRLAEVISGGLIAQALETYDADRQTDSIEAARAQRAEVLERFPVDEWPGMPLDRYALGQADHPDNFCRWMEFRATELGSIKGGSARKHHIYFQQKGEWWFERDRYSDVEEAWAEVRAGFVEALALAEASEWDAIDRVPALKGGPALLAKTLHVYHPEEILPICSHAHLVHFLRALGERAAGLDGIGTVTLNRLLLHGLEECGELNGWSTKEMERLLYISDFSPFNKDVPSGLIGDVDAFVAEAIESYGDAGIETRRAAEDQARALLDESAGRMKEPQLRELLKLFNADSHRGRRYQSRFSPAFVGATANGLAANLDKVNAWTERLWGDGQEGATAAIGELLADRKLLPSSGTSYPTMLLYLRASASFAVWLQPTDSGLQRLRASYRPERTPGAGRLEDYLAFCAAATEFMRDHEVPPELLDAVLAAASRVELEEEPARASASVWIFQANPDIFDIDRAVSEEPEMTWVVRQYKKEICKGDRVYLWRSGPEAGVIATATVLADPEVLPGVADSPYALKPESLDKAEPRVRLRIDEVLPAPIKRVDLLEDRVLKDLEVVTFPNATNFRVTPEQDATLRDLVAEPAPLAVPSVRSELAGDLHLPQSFLDGAVDLLLDKGQAIFYGPPGTGKTWIALELAKELTRDGGSVDIIQFHPSYAYEDFVGGFRPEEDGSSNGARFKRADGPLRRIATEAKADPGHPYLLIVDEINRGNIPKIFGELLFLLEYRRREVRLQYWPEALFSLPENLFLIGTMNTADRSIALVDAALRRRFYFVEFSPVKAPVSEVLPRWLEEHGLSPEPAALLKRLNHEIGDDDFCVGPSYFMSRDGEAPNVERIWERAILPLLHEHFYGTGWDPDRFGLAAVRRLVEASGDSG